MSSKQIIERLNEIGIGLEEINAIFLTHEHSDHIKGLKVLSSKVECFVHATKETVSSLEVKCEINIIEENAVIEINENLKVYTIKTSHDANNSIGYKFVFKDKEIVHITDTGYITNSIMEKTNDAFAYIIESNYEDSVLMVNDKYPFNVKKRILSDEGHLSNKQCNDYLLEIIGNTTKHIIFAHLSENNNAHDLVREIHGNIAVESKVILSKSEIVKVELCK